ncbi:MAG: hypothetical protein U1E65_28075 [Myxococcota bacterium]
MRGVHTLGRPKRVLAAEEAPIAEKEGPAPSTPSLGPIDPAALPSKEASAKVAGGRVHAVRSTVDGVVFLEKTLAEIRFLRRHHPEMRPVVVFDLDNTVFETRARTLLALHAYDEARGTHYFDHIKTIAQVGKNGAHSAELAKTVPPELFADVQQFWLDWFWKGENFQHDALFPKVAALAREAKRAGAEVIYLTGRVDRLNTLAELEAGKLPFADEAHLVTKGKVGANTGDFKANWFKELLKDPQVFIGWFMTEGCRDIQSIQTAEERVPCVRLGYVHERSEVHRVRADTPTLPETWTRKTRPLPSKHAGKSAP